MKKTILSAPLSFRASALVLATAFLAIGAVELKSIRAKEAASRPKHAVMDTAYCVKCHKDAKTIRVMSMKEDGANFLFKPDGTFKDPKFASLNPDFHHTAHTAPLPK